MSVTQHCVTEREEKKKEKRAEIIYSTNKTKDKNVDIAFHGTQIQNKQWANYVIIWEITME